MIDIELINRELDEVDAMLSAQEELELSTAELKQAVRGGAGSPIEQRLAQAFEDQSKVSAAIERELLALSKQNDRMRCIIEEQAELIDRQNQALNDVASAMVDIQQELGERAYEATAKTLESQRDALDLLERQADRTVGALRQIDEGAADNYKMAVDGACERLMRCTSIAAALMVFLGIAGGIFALFGGYWVILAFPAAKAFVRAHIWVPVAALLALMLVVFVLGWHKGKQKRH